MENNSPAHSHVVAVDRKITLYLKKEGTASSEDGFSGRIIGVGEKNFVAVIDSYAARHTNLPQDYTLYCTVTGDNCIYQFVTEFTGRSETYQNVWCLNIPRVFSRCQHRNFVRVQATDLAMTVKYPRNAGHYSDPVDVLLRDISGGGLGFVSERPVSIDKKLMVEVSGLPGLDETLQTFGLVRRCQKVTSLGATVSYNVGLHIEPFLSKNEQNKLLRSINEIQRVYLQKGLGIK